MLLIGSRVIVKNFTPAIADTGMPLRIRYLIDADRSRISISPSGITARIGHDSQSVICLGSAKRPVGVKKPKAIKTARGEAQKHLEFIK
jgi:hypothetical protein